MQTRGAGGEDPSGSRRAIGAGARTRPGRVRHGLRDGRYGENDENMTYLPFAVLLLAILTTPWRSAPYAVYLAAGALGLALGTLEPVALAGLAALALAIVAIRRLPIPGGVATLILAGALSNYLLPGFHNLPVFQDHAFSSNSAPFTMYLNFDKTSAGLLLYLLWIRDREDPWTRAKLKTAGLTLAVLILAMLPLAYAMGYVRLEPKWPALWWVWMLNNLFFVCLAEEALFRGFIQASLRGRGAPAALAIAVAAALFGLAHYRGGLSYIALATVAGVFYGYAFERTRRLGASMLVHFGLNLVHFFLFTYPFYVRTLPSAETWGK